MVDWDKTFYDRRKSARREPQGRTTGVPAGVRERRQFADSHTELSSEAREFARAVDGYKLSHARKFVTLGEIYEIFISLGYHK